MQAEFVEWYDRIMLSGTEPRECVLRAVDKGGSESAALFASDLCVMVQDDWRQECNVFSVDVGGDGSAVLKCITVGAEQGTLDEGCSVTINALPVRGRVNDAQ